jgi:16S rRNA (adenine1518-N6/adenine1519-N6)-dimethyltransferase
MKLSEMRAVLARNDLRLTKSLGQNFLHDGNQVRRIVALAGVQPGDDILEIGPGLGPLTDPLLAAGARVLAIEKDARLIPLLRERWPDHPRLELLHDDALVWLRSAERDLDGWKVVSNLPYSVGSPILVELALAQRGPDQMIVTLQVEVMERMLAQPGTAQYGQLTLLVGLHYEPAGSHRIPACCFFPAPDVDSGCVRLCRRAAPLLAQEHAPTFQRLVKASFAQRRKMMLKLLKPHWPAASLEAAFDALGLAPTVRSEDVSLAQFASLAARLGPPGPAVVSRAARKGGL